MGHRALSESTSVHIPRCFLVAYEMFTIFASCTPKMSMMSFCDLCGVPYGNCARRTFPGNNTNPASEAINFITSPRTFYAIIIYAHAYNISHARTHQQYTGEYSLKAPKMKAYLYVLLSARIGFNYDFMGPARRARVWHIDNPNPPFVKACALALSCIMRNVCINSDIHEYRTVHFKANLNLQYTFY